MSDHSTHTEEIRVLIAVAAACMLRYGGYVAPVTPGQSHPITPAVCGQCRLIRLYSILVLSDC